MKTLDLRLITLDTVHKDNITRLTQEFGEDKEPHVVARYLHQLNWSEENPGLNGTLQKITYQKTRETLRSEYS